MQSRNREKRNDKDHHEKASFFGFFVLFLGKTFKKQSPKGAYKKNVLRNFAKLTGKVTPVPKSLF